MAKEDHLIMAVDKKSLFGNDYFEGFRTPEGIDFMSRILTNFKYLRRSDVEQNPDFKQPIGYCVILNPQTKQVFVYQRSPKNLHYFEKRLQGKWSWGLGGHIEKVDDNGKNPILTSLLRELREEVDLDSFSPPRLLGYINDEHNEVGKVHFGILYVLETDLNDVRPKDSEITQGKLISVQELEEICSSTDFAIEDWSRISFPPIKNYLQVRGPH